MPNRGNKPNKSRKYGDFPLTPRQAIDATAGNLGAGDGIETDFDKTNPLKCRKSGIFQGNGRVFRPGRGSVKAMRRFIPKL